MNASSYDFSSIIHITQNEDTLTSDNFNVNLSLIYYYINILILKNNFAEKALKLYSFLEFKYSKFTVKEGCEISDIHKSSRQLEKEKFQKEISPQNWSIFITK